MTIGLWYWGRKGGGCRFTRSIAQGLVEAGVGAAASLSSDNEVADLWRGESGVNVRWVAIDAQPRHLSRVATLLWGRQSIGEWYRRQECDVVVFTMAHPFLLPALISVKRSGLATCLVVHDAERHPGDRGRVVHLLTRLAARRATAIVALTQYVAVEIVRSWHCAAPVYVMPHGPLYPEATAATPPAPSSAPRFLYFGRLRAYKGIELLLEAWPRVRASLPEATLTIVGHGDESSWGPAARGLPGVTVDNRWVPDAEVPTVFAGCDAVVLPYAEASQSGVIPLAHDMGVRVVATRVGGIVEQVGAADVLVAPTVTSIAEGMLEISRSPVVPAPAPVRPVELGRRLSEVVARIVTPR